MPRKHTIRTNVHPYHIVSRTNHKTWFKLPLDEVWALALDSLSLANQRHPVNFHAFVLMVNHYHLVIDTPNCDVDKFMYEFNKNFSLQLRDKTNLENKMFGGRYKWSLISSTSHYLNVLKYVFRNPIKANVCNSVKDYPFSSLMHFPEIISAYVTLEKYINWFNEPHSIEQNESISRGLRNKFFRYVGTRIERITPDFHTPDIK